MKLVTMGEVLLRLSAPKNGKISEAASFEAAVGGSEANVAVAFSGFGGEAALATVLPEGPLGDAALCFLRGKGVDVRAVSRKEGRMGLYFFEHGASLRAGKVLYDRAFSSFSKAGSEDFDFDKILKDADMVHVSGITPALGEGPRAAVYHLIKAAKSRGIFVSFDVNYRAALWTEEEAERIFGELLPLVDLGISSSDGGSVLGLENAGTDPAALFAMAENFRKKFGLRYAALTVRNSLSASHNELSGVFASDTVCASSVYPVEIVDRVGGGDAFSAGLIYALSEKFSMEEAIDFAAACDAYKHTVCGDCMQASPSDIFAIMRGETRLRR